MSGVGPHCRSCGAPILWAVTEGGNRIPLDRLPNDAGNVALLNRYRPDGSPVVTVFRDAQQAYAAGYTRRYMPHHATCPNADEWRRKPKR